MSARLLRQQHRGRSRLLIAALVFSGLLVGLAGEAAALVYASEEPAPLAEPPSDFPYWESVGHFNWEGPSLVYLGGGYVLTAQHVGLGQVVLEDRTYLPIRTSRRGLLSLSGKPADATVFRIDDRDGLPDLPLLPLAETPPVPGEEVLMIGFGRGGREELTVISSGDEELVGRRWNDDRKKRWGTNRVRGDRPVIETADFRTRCFLTRFDRQTVATATPYEAQPAVGDSGGAVFVHRPDGWKLAGIMISVESGSHRPKAISLYGDHAYHMDITEYAGEIARYGRPTCANGYDDDGDGRIDFPDDPDCSSAVGDENPSAPAPATPLPRSRSTVAWVAVLASLGLTIVLVRRSVGESA